MSSLKVRTLSGIIFLIVMVGGLMLSEYLYAALVMLMMTGMMWEFFHITMGGEAHKATRILMVISGLVLFLLMFISEKKGTRTCYLPVAMSIGMISAISMLFEKDKSRFTDIAFVMAGFLYIAVPLSLSTLIAFRDGVFDGTLLLSFFIIIWCSDVGAYALGMGFGQKEGSRKLCPTISPKKSWIGLWGGLAFAMAGTVVIKYLGLIHFPWYHCLALGLVMSLSGVAGDLFESMWKRSYSLKDSGDIIPGHGGLLDRFDSTLMAMPFGAIYLVLFNLI